VKFTQKTNIYIDKLGIEQYSTQRIPIHPGLFQIGHIMVESKTSGNYHFTNEVPEDLLFLFHSAICWSKIRNYNGMFEDKRETCKMR